jgi:hypothetical protein
MLTNFFKSTRVTCFHCKVHSQNSDVFCHAFLTGNRYKAVRGSGGGPAWLPVAGRGCPADTRLSNGLAPKIINEARLPHPSHWLVGRQRRRRVGVERARCRARTRAATCTHAREKGGKPMERDLLRAPSPMQREEGVGARLKQRKKVNEG